MLMKIDCEVIKSIKVKLTFDNKEEKITVIGINDIVRIEYNKNGCRNTVIGKVTDIVVNGSDPKGWYITVDSSDDFESKLVNFTASNILDADIITKAGLTMPIETPIGDNQIAALRIIDGVLQYRSTSGGEWKTLNFNE